MSLTHLFHLSYFVAYVVYIMVTYVYFFRHICGPKTSHRFTTSNAPSARPEHNHRFLTQLNGSKPRSSELGVEFVGGPQILRLRSCLEARGALGPGGLAGTDDRTGVAGLDFRRRNQPSTTTGITKKNIQ